MENYDAVTAMVDCQLHLDRYYRRILNDVAKWSERLYKEVFGSRGTAEIADAVIEQWMTDLVKGVYTAMGEALYLALPMLQAEDFRNREELVNFYFWPGYSTASIAERPRLYIQEPSNEKQNKLGSMLAMVGVGYCGRPGQQEIVQKYFKSCQTRWFHYATSYPARLSRYPGSLYRWFNEQVPCLDNDEPFNLLHSFSVQVESELQEAKGRYRVFTIPNMRETPSSQWGQMLAAAINQMNKELVVTNPALVYPDRTGKNDERYRNVRNLLTSLWMHSIFCDTPPDWIDDLFLELRTQGLHDTEQWIREGWSTDEMAKDWGDKQINPRRPLFRDWTTISLYPGISHPYIRDSAGDRAEFTQPVGSAILLSSVPLRPLYISTVRAWIRSVYGLLVGVDSAIQTYNRSVRKAEEVGQGLAMIAGPWFGHELAKVFKTTFQSVRGQLGRCDDKAVRLRRRAWDTLEAISELSNHVGRAITGGDRQVEMRRLRQRFREPFHKAAPLGPDFLVNTGLTVAKSIYVKIDSVEILPELESIPFEDSQVAEIDNELLAVFLLVLHELITNFRKHQVQRGKNGHLFAASTESQMRFRIESDTDRDEQIPESMTFQLLNVFLTRAGLGDAATGWVAGMTGRRYYSEVKINLLGEPEDNEAAQTPNDSSQ